MTLRWRHVLGLLLLLWIGGLATGCSVGFGLSELVVRSELGALQREANRLETELAKLKERCP